MIIFLSKEQKAKYKTWRKTIQIDTEETCDIGYDVITVTRGSIGDSIVASYGDDQCNLTIDDDGFLINYGDTFVYPEIEVDIQEYHKKLKEFENLLDSQ